MTKQSITSDQQKQYDRFLEDAGNRALNEVAPDKDGLQRLFARGGEFQAYVVTGIRRFSAKTPNYDLARTILGKDFISPEEIAKSRGVTYIDDQFAKFGESLPTEEDLNWCRANNMMLVAGPPNAMSLTEVREVKNAYFYSKTGGWYVGDREKFSWNDKAESGWLALLKKEVAGSLNENWATQSGLVTLPMIVPNAGEATWGLTTYKAVRGIELHPNVYVRTSSVVSDGSHVSVGFHPEGLSVNDWSDGSCVPSIGVSGARKWVLKS